MRKIDYAVSALLLINGVISPSVLAENAQNNQYRFPSVNNVVEPQGMVAQQYPGYMYPQAMTQTYRQPMYYGYPVTAYYPPTRQGQAIATMPYGYPQGHPQIQAQQGQSMGQATQPVPQYRSPYNPNIAATPGPKPKPKPQPKKEVKPWGDTRYIWPDFYTDFTGDFWDEMINAPYQMGYMPGGWRFPTLSTPDPVTVGDAVANQVPPILDEGANFIDFAN
uniref:Uncharacterized protein n=1 Tax=uncultured Thiotrichaceae bacterium TaxID=298394 RepID=A0A6S6UIQ7_9GAMM|nr:MAG: Unknown protein [uncultured Thiotrichaceae bacterium]